MANNRIYYAVQQVKLGQSNSNMTAIHGLQTVGMTTNFNLEQVFEMGQLAIYQNVEEVPDIEVTLNKVLDGYPLIYVLATETGTSIPGVPLAANASIPGRQNARCDMTLSIFSDTLTSISGASAQAEVTCSGMYVSSVSYTFPVDGNFTEDVTLVGNNKVWGTTTTSSGSITTNDEPLSDTGVGRRQFLKMDSCRFPTQIPGIGGGPYPTGTVIPSGAANGVNVQWPGGSGYAVHFQNITVSCDFGREAIQELGTFAPYHRFVTFPVEVTSEFEVVSTHGDRINATESGYYNSAGTVYTTGNACSVRRNLIDQEIYLETCEGTRIYLGAKNKLTSVNYTGGDTGGGNVSVTYSYSTFNDFYVTHTETIANISGVGIGGTYGPAA